MCSVGRLPMSMSVPATRSSFLHGNPTSSFLWRNIWPHCEGLGRCLAPDLIGMGDSDKLPDSGPARYTFIEHRRYLDAWFDQLDLTMNVTLVVHDWGSSLGFDWARRHPDAIKGIAYMEAIVSPISWDAFPAAGIDTFKAFRSPDGEKLILDDNLFVEAVLPAATLRQLSDEEMAEYRRPFTERGEARRPTLTWPRQIPIDGEPTDVTEIVAAYRDWLATSPVPKLFINAEPGALITGAQRAVPNLPQPDRNHRQRRALHPRRQPSRHRHRACRLVSAHADPHLSNMAHQLREPRLGVSRRPGREHAGARALRGDVVHGHVCGAEQHGDTRPQAASWPSSPGRSPTHRHGPRHPHRLDTTVSGYRAR
jgi:haloalkane dehalogenase